jgi:hypothetical protein
MDGRRTPVRDKRKEPMPVDYMLEFDRITRTIRDGRWERKVGIRAIDALLDEYNAIFGVPGSTYA